MSTLDEIEREVLALSSDDRAYLVAVLEQSLEIPDFESPEIAALWMEEIERRALAYDRGEMQAEDWRVVMSELKKNSSHKTTNAPDLKIRSAVDF